MATDPSKLALPPGFVLDTDPSGAPVASTPLLRRQAAPPTATEQAGLPYVAPKAAAEVRTATANAQIAEHKASEEGNVVAKQQAERRSAAEAADALVMGIRRARSFINDSDFSTGLGYAALSHVPGTDAAKLDAVINQEIRGNIFLNRINQLRQENDSPNGGTGIGRIMQAEIPLITGSIGTLDPGKLGKKEMLNSLLQIEARTLRTKAILAGEDPDDPAIKKKYGIPELPKYDDGKLKPGEDIQFGDESGPPKNPMNPQQQAAYDAWLKANPQATPDQLRSFVQSIGLPGATNAEEVIDAYRKTGRFTPGSGALPTPPDISDMRGKGGVGEKVDATLRSAANVVPFMDEASAGLHMLGGGTYRQNLDRERAIDQYDWEHNFPEVIAGTIAGGALIPTKAGMMARGARAHALASGATEEVANAAAKAAFTGRIAKEGAAYGAASGVGSEGDLGQRLEKGAVGAVTGAAIGAIGGKLFGPKGPKTPSGGGPAPGDIAEAMSAEDIPGGRPVADPTQRGKMSYLETTRGGHSVVRSVLEKTRTAIADKVAGLAGDGEALTPGGIGETIQTAGQRTLKGARERAGRLYTRAADMAAANPVSPSEALSALDQHIADLSHNPGTNRGVLAYLKTVRGDLAKAGKTVADIRDIRTGMSGEINRRNLGQSNAERIMGDVLAAGRRDVERDLGKSNPDALRLYQRADDMWSRMSADKKQVIERLTGPADNKLAGEQVMSRVRAMMGNRGDAKRFQRVMNMLEPRERADFAASLFDSIGQKSPEEPFSPAHFLAQTKDMQPEALKTVFGADGARSIMNLRVASRGFTDAQSSLNQSRSGFVANFKDFVSSVASLKHGVGALIGYHIAGTPGMVAGAMAGETIQRTTNYLSAKLLMNPDVSQWIRAVSKVRTEREARRLIGRLNRIGAGNATVQTELSGFRDMIANAANDNFTKSGSVAASPDQRPDQKQ